MKKMSLALAICALIAGAGAHATVSSGSVVRSLRCGEHCAPRRGGDAMALDLLRLKGGAKKEKAPDEFEGIKAPKRALSAYMIYSNQIRPELMKQNPEMKITEISGHIAEKWKSLGDTDRAKLQAQADSLRKEYELQKADYEKAVPEAVRKERVLTAKKKKAGKPAKDPNLPKKPLSAFMIYSNSIREKVRAENPDLGFGDIGKKIATLWNAKSTKEKEEFEKQAVAAREKFLVEKSKYDASQPPKPEAPPKKEKKEKASASSEKKSAKPTKEKKKEVGKVAKDPKKEVKKDKEKPPPTTKEGKPQVKK